MEYAIIMLEEQLETLERVYKDFVISGKVSETSYAAIDNRKKAEEIKKGLEHLLQ